MRKPKTLLKPAAINRTVTSHPAALALSQLLPEIRKHMNHAEELARPHKKKKADTKTKGENNGQRHSSPPGSNDSGRREQTSQGGGIMW